jgi:hypothetical protein
MAKPFPPGRSSLAGLRCTGRLLDACDEPGELDACRLSLCASIAGFVTTSPLFTRFSSIWRHSSQYTPTEAGFPHIVQYTINNYLLADLE